MAELRLSWDDVGRTVPVSMGDEVVLALPENPTSGFRWHLELEDAVVLVSDAFTSDAASTLGGGGVREVRLRPAERGLLRVVCRLHRSWSPGDPRQVGEFLLQVR